MISLKHKSKGFTIVELLIVIVIIAILATLVIVTFTGIQKKARDSQRQTDIIALDSHLEAFYAEHGFYPSYKDVTTASWVSANMKGLDPNALLAPNSSTVLANTDPATATTTTSYNYYPMSGSAACTASATTEDAPDANGNWTDNGCDGFHLGTGLESGGTFIKNSNT